MTSAVMGRLFGVGARRHSPFRSEIQGTALRALASEERGERYGTECGQQEGGRLGNELEGVKLSMANHFPPPELKKAGWPPEEVKYKLSMSK